MTGGFSLLADPLHLSSSEINSGRSQLPLLAHLSLTKQGVSGSGALCWNVEKRKKETAHLEKRRKGEEVVRHAQGSRIPTVALSMFSPFPRLSPQLQCPFMCLFVHQTSVEHLPSALCSVPWIQGWTQWGRSVPLPTGHLGVGWTLARGSWEC